MLEREAIKAKERERERVLERDRYGEKRKA